MNLVQDSLAAVRLGAPQVHRNLALFPLVAQRNQAPGYVLLDEALERKLARVTEVSDGGSVPELAFENASAEKILLVDDSKTELHHLTDILSKRGYAVRSAENGEDAMRPICRYGFLDLDLHRLELTVAAFNVRAVRCYEKVGFTARSAGA